MTLNMGTADRSIRVVVALVLAGLYFGNVVTGTLGLVLVAVAVLFALTGAVGVCPGYLPFGFSTRGKSAG